MGERNFTRLTSSTTAYVLSHFGDTHTHGHTHVRATQSPLEWFVTLMALPFFWVGGGLLIVWSSSPCSVCHSQ